MQDYKYFDSKSGKFKDDKILNDIRKSAEMYENGEIVESVDLLDGLVTELRTIILLVDELH